jgi:hypothetical protein
MNLTAKNTVKGVPEQVLFIKKYYKNINNRELRNCGSPILKVRNCSSATFSSPQLIRWSAILRSCE